MFSCEFCEIFKSTFFIEHLRTTTSDNQNTEPENDLVGSKNASADKKGKFKPKKF